MTTRKSSASGSEKRQRAHVVTIRVNGPERVELNHRAERAGLSIPAYIRHRSLDIAPPAQRHRPAVETVMLARLLGQVGQIGSDVNSLAERVSRTSWVTQADLRMLDGLHNTLSQWTAELLRAMGRDYDHDDTQ